MPTSRSSAGRPCAQPSDLDSATASLILSLNLSWEISTRVPMQTHFIMAAKAELAVKTLRNQTDCYISNTLMRHLLFEDLGIGNATAL